MSEKPHERLQFMLIGTWNEARGMERLLGRDPEQQERMAHALIGMHRVISERTHPLGEEASLIAMEGIRLALVYLSIELPEWYSVEALAKWHADGGDRDLPYRTWVQDPDTVTQAMRIIEKPTARP